MKKINPKIVAGLALVFLCLWVGIFFYVWRSDAYEFAAKFASGNSVVISHIGQIESHSLSIKKFSLGSKGKYRYAKLYISLKGATSNGTVYFQLIETKERWHVERAFLYLQNGQKIELQ